MSRLFPDSIFQQLYYCFLVTLVVCSIFSSTFSKAANDARYSHQFSTLVQGSHFGKIYRTEYPGQERFDTRFSSNQAVPASEVMTVAWHQHARNSLLICIKPDSTGHEPITLQNHQGNASLIALYQNPELLVYKLQLKTLKGKSELKLNGSLFKECNLPLMNKEAKDSSFQIQLAIFNKKKKTRKKTLPMPGAGLKASSEQDESPSGYPGLSDPFDLNDFKRGKAPVLFHDILISLLPPTLHPDTANESSESNVVIEVNYGPWQWLLELESREWDLLVSYGLDNNPQALLMLAQQQASGRRVRDDILRSLSQSLLTEQQVETALWLDELEGLSPQRLSIYSGIEALLLEKILSESGVSIPAIIHLQANPSEYLQQLQRLIFFLSNQRSLEHLLELLGELPQALISELTAQDIQQADDADSVSARISENIGYLWTLISDIVAHNLMPQPTATYTPTPVQATTGTGTGSSASVTPGETNSANTASTTISSDGMVSSLTGSGENSGFKPPDKDQTARSKNAAIVRSLAYYVNQSLKTDDHKGDEIDGAIQFLNQLGMKDHLDSLLEQLKFGKKPLSIPGIRRTLLKKGYFSKGFLLTFIWLTKRNDQTFRELLEQTEGGLLIIKQLETRETGGFHIIRALLQHGQKLTIDTKGINQELLDLLDQIAVPTHIPEADPQLVEDGLFKLSIFYDLYRSGRESEMVNWRREQFRARPLPDFLKRVDETCVFELKSDYLLSEAIEFFRIWVEAGISTLKRKGDQLILNPYSDESSLTPMQFVEILKEYMSELSAIDLASTLGISDAAVLDETLGSSFGSEEPLQMIRSKHRTRREWLVFFNSLQNSSPGLCSRHDIVFESWRYEQKETDDGHFLVRNEGVTLKAVSTGDTSDCSHSISAINRLIANTVRLAHSILVLLSESSDMLPDLFGAAAELVCQNNAGDIQTDLWEHDGLIPYENLKNTPFYRPLQLFRAALELLQQLRTDPQQELAAGVLLHKDYLQQLILNDIYDLESPLAREMSGYAIHDAASEMVDKEKLKTLLAAQLKNRRYSWDFITKKLLGPDPLTQGELMLCMHQMRLESLLSDLFDPLDYKLLYQYLGNSSISITEKERTLLKRDKGHYRVVAYQKLKTLRVQSEKFESKRLTPFWLKRWALQSGAMQQEHRFEEESVFTFLLSMNTHWIPQKYNILIGRLELDAEPPDESVLQPTVVECPGERGCLLTPVNILEVAPQYTPNNVPLSNCYCDACGALMFEINYKTGERIVNQSVVRHCRKHGMDLCKDCLKQPCTVEGCQNQLTYILTQRRTFKRKYPAESTNVRITCDHCKKQLAIVKLEPNPKKPATNADGERVEVTKGCNYILHCIDGHDICTSCLLASRNQQPYLSKEFNYGRAIIRDENCFVCYAPTTYREVVHCIPSHDKTFYSHLSCIPAQIGYSQPKPAVIPQARALEKEEKPELDAGDTCIICLTSKRTHAFLHGERAHMVVCGPCAREVVERQGSCPFCREELTGVKVVELCKP